MNSIDHTGGFHVNRLALESSRRGQEYRHSILNKSQQQKERKRKRVAGVGTGRGKGRVVERLDWNNETRYVAYLPNDRSVGTLKSRKDAEEILKNALELKVRGVRHVGQDSHGDDQFESFIVLQGEIVHVSFHHTIQEASDAYDEAAKRMFGKRADLNDPLKESAISEHDLRYFDILCGSELKNTVQQVINSQTLERRQDQRHGLFSIDDFKFEQEQQVSESRAAKPMECDPFGMGLPWRTKVMDLHKLSNITPLVQHASQLCAGVTLCIHQGSRKNEVAAALAVLLRLVKPGSHSKAFALGGMEFVNLLVTVFEASKHVWSTGNHEIAPISDLTETCLLKLALESHGSLSVRLASHVRPQATSLDIITGVLARTKNSDQSTYVLSVVCSCCDQVFSPRRFALHAGCVSLKGNGLDELEFAFGQRNTTLRKFGFRLSEDPGAANPNCKSRRLMSKDIEHDMSKDIEHDMSKDIEHDMSKDIEHDMSKDIEHDMSKDIEHDMSKDIEHDMSKPIFMKSGVVTPQQPFVKPELDPLEEIDTDDDSRIFASVPSTESLTKKSRNSDERTLIQFLRSYLEIIRTKLTEIEKTGSVPSNPNQLKSRQDTRQKSQDEMRWVDTDILQLLVIQINNEIMQSFVRRNDIDHAIAHAKECLGNDSYARHGHSRYLIGRLFILDAQLNGPLRVGTVLNQRQQESLRSAKVELCKAVELDPGQCDALYLALRAEQLLHPGYPDSKYCAANFLDLNLGPKSDPSKEFAVGSSSSENDVMRGIGGASSQQQQRVAQSGDLVDYNTLLTLAINTYNTTKSLQCLRIVYQASRKVEWPRDWVHEMLVRMINLSHCDPHGSATGDVLLYATNLFSLKAKFDLVAGKYDRLANVVKSFSRSIATWILNFGGAGAPSIKTLLSDHRVTMRLDEPLSSASLTANKLWIVYAGLVRLCETLNQTLVGRAREYRTHFNVLTLLPDALIERDLKLYSIVSGNQALGLGQLRSSNLDRVIQQRLLSQMMIAIALKAKSNNSLVAASFERFVSTVRTICDQSVEKEYDKLFEHLK